MKEKTISCRVSSKEYERVLELAKARGMSVSAFVSEAVESYVKFDDVQKRISELENNIKLLIRDSNHEVLDYLQQIYYHSLRGDMGNIEYAKMTQKSGFAERLNQAIEEEVKRYNE